MSVLANARRLIFLFAWFLWASLACAEINAKDRFAAFGKGEFAPLGPGTFSGWRLKSEDGKTYGRDFLNKQAGSIEVLGVEAVPVAIDHLTHPHIHIRYIAAESLRRITKQDPVWYVAGVPGEAINGNKTWSADAIKIWKTWYENHQNLKAGRDKKLSDPESRPTRRRPNKTSIPLEAGGARETTDSSPKKQ